MVDRLIDVGFGGILVDRDGYVDEGLAIKASLRGILGVDPLVSPDGRRLFFDLAGHGRHEDVGRGRPDDVGQSSADVSFKQYLTLHPIAENWDQGCYYVEHDGETAFRWCDATGEIQLDNDTAFRRKVLLRMRFAAAHSPARLILGGDLVSASMDLGDLVRFAREIDVAPGRHVIRFACDGRRADAPADPRTLVFRVEGVVLEDLVTTPQQAN
jgi:hypothetical protein